MTDSVHVVCWAWSMTDPVHVVCWAWPVSDPVHVVCLQVTKKVQKALGAPSKQWGCECKLAISVDDFTIRNGVNNRVSV